MNELSVSNESRAAQAFSKQAAVFDRQYRNDTIIRYKRQRVREHLEQYLPANSHILELNAGTGEDAIYFSQHGHRVHATDIAKGMLEQLEAKKKNSQLNDLLTSEQCDFTHLEQLTNNGPYDCIFSNFAGLNCTDRLDKVLGSMERLLKPGGFVTLVILPRFCLWETLLLFKGKFKTAFRRFNGSRGADARVEGIHFTCWYYPPSFVIKHLPGFELLSLEGLCTFVPPSYLEGFAEKHPRIYKKLTGFENRWRKSWPWKLLGDYYIISLRKQG